MPLSFSYSTAATAGSREDPDTPAVSTVTEPNYAETTAAATGFTATTAEDNAETHACQCKCLLENKTVITRPRSAVCKVSGNRCESDCRSRGREFDPGLIMK